MFTKKEIINTARKQFTLDYNCKNEDFLKEGNTIVDNILLDGSRTYDEEQSFLRILVTNGRAIFYADDKIKPWLEEKFLNLDASWLFDYGKLRAIDNKLREYGYEIDQIPHYYLPNPVVSEINPTYQIKWYEQEDIEQFRDDERFDESFVFDDNYPDVLGVAAFDGDTIVGMAGASADSSELYQIGINVIDGYEGKGIGTHLITLLKQGLLNRGKIPFYGTSISHIASRNIAINSGFFPAWAELYSRKVKG